MASSSSFPTLSLPNGKIPQIAYGTGTAWYRGSNDTPFDQKLVDSILEAMNLGYTHLDCAEMYGTEKDVGVAIKQYLNETGKDRSSIFVTTKVYRTLNDIERALHDSLERLQLDYVDLYLIHAPFSMKNGQAGITLKEAWNKMEKFVDEKKVRNIGVSNFRVDDLKELFALTPKIKPCVNQIEYHPYVNAASKELLAYCRQNNILIESYSPLASIVHKKDGPIDAIVEALAVKYGKSHIHILLKWNMQKGHVIVTTSSKGDRLKSYLQAGDADWKLTDDEIKQIDDAGAKLHYRKFWTKEFDG
ncbi:unnamed protein product [Didymodactylos carnosus]|uniref:NADP-dependent oxidoreductase domain-containing protein n=1 Tax=Didymodactylos carnosus TaxID=1234261 RepID=A0A815T1H9_9BILA|nr:unnamed protein product [Didymodactylos carnosus]CAF4357730.1 unnamed protein product [Didymodactylos carnosus]